MLKNCRRRLNNKGFFLIDLLLSVSIWVLIAGAILPMFIHIQKQTLDVRQELSGNHLLYEAAQAFLLHGQQTQGPQIRDKFQYNLYWEDKKVCVAYENHFKEQVEKCETIY